MQIRTRREALALLATAGALVSTTSRRARAEVGAKVQSWPLTTRRPTGIHDVAPAPDGGVWFTAQRSGHLGWFDPKSGTHRAHRARRAARRRTA